MLSKKEASGILHNVWPRAIDLCIFLPVEGLGRGGDEGGEGGGGTLEHGTDSLVWNGHVLDLAHTLQLEPLLLSWMLSMISDANIMSTSVTVHEETQLPCAFHLPSVQRIRPLQIEQR